MKLFYGEENYLIDQEIALRAKELNIKPTIFSEEDDLENIILDITTVSMFFDKKIVVIRNHNVISNANAATKFMNAVKGLDETVEIIFVIEESKLPKSLLIDFIKEHGIIKEFKKLSDSNIASTIKEIVGVKGGQITNGAAIKFASKVPSDLRIIILEIEKLLAQSNEIDEKMIETSIGEYVRDDTFALANALSSNDHHAILAAYSERKKAGEEPTYLIGQIASTFSLVLQVNSLRRQGLSNQDISDRTKIHIFRIKKSSDIIAKTSIEKVQKLVVKLAMLDADIKTGKVEAELGLDNFILEVVK